MEQFGERFNGEVTVGVDPFLVDLYGEGPHPAQKAGLVVENAHDVRATIDLLIEPLEQVGRLEMFVMGARKPAEHKGLLDAAAWLRVLRMPALQPLAEIATGLSIVLLAVEPMLFPQKRAIGVAQQVIELAAPEVHLATFPQRRRQHFRDGLQQALGWPVTTRGTSRRHRS